MRAALLAACMLLLSGCASWIGPPLLQIPPAALGRERTLEQRVVFERQSERMSFESVLEIDAERLRMVATAMGLRLFSLDYDGHAIEQGAGLPMPRGLPPEWVVDDTLFVLAPTAALDAALPESWRLEDSGRQRRVFLGERLIVEVRRDSDDPDNGHAELIQHALGYRLSIDTREVE